MDKDFFCPEPYKNISSKPYGYWQACCIASDESVKLHGMKLEDTTFLDFYHSDYMNQLREDMKIGKMSETVIKTCKNCIHSESRTGTSRRTEQLEVYNKEDILNKKFSIDLIRLKFIGNLCNAKCVTCFPEISSLFAQEAKNLGTYDGPTIINTPLTDFYLNGLKEVLPVTKKLKFIGGEPLINKDTWKFIDWLNLNELYHLELHFTTNGKQYFKPEQEVILNKFKSIDVSISIDGIGEKNNYIRYPSPFVKIIENLTFFANADISLKQYNIQNIYNIHAGEQDDGSLPQTPSNQINVDTMST